MKKHSAGLLVYRKADSSIEVLIAHMGGPFHAKKDVGHWSIPKGEHEKGENPKTVAQREFNEELGKKAPGGQWLDLGDIEYKNGKKVVAWAVEGNLDVSEVKSNTFEMEWPPRSGKMQEFPEIDHAAYFPLDVAAKKLIPAQVELLQRLAQKLGIKMQAGSEPSKPVQPPLF
jgi:predicted NUDIX family NTP pyrophosphohydrolase